MGFIQTNVLANVKFFDHLLVDDDDDNYYMEREWRVSANIPFGLRDVRRLIIPERYSRAIRRDFPSYYGQVTFADGDE